MKRRRFLFLGAAALAPAIGWAQRSRATIGILSARAKSFFVPHLMQRLAELGFREGAGLRLEYRHVDGRIERFPEVARELAAARCDLIFAIGPADAPRALQQAKVAAPVVFVAVDYDPLAHKIIDSLVRPGRNVTGLYTRSPQIALKKFEVARELVPEAKRHLILADAYSRDQLLALRNAAAVGGMELTVADFTRRPYNYAEALERERHQNIQALQVLTSPAFADDRTIIAALASARRLPVVGFITPEDSFLIGYSSSVEKLGRRLAEIGVRILNGAKAGEMPVEQTDEFDLGVNLKLARPLGVEVPYAILARAARIVE
jgi:putative ABC transport system substrate-binding protein